MKILIVDDEKDLLEVLESWFEDDSTVEIVTTLTIEEAKNKLIEDKWDLVLLDYNLGEETVGVELIRYLRSKPEYKFLPTIIMSGTASSEVVISYSNLAFLSKPFKKEQLLDLAKICIEKIKERKKTPHLDPIVMQRLTETTQEIVQNFISGKVSYGPPEKKLSRSPAKSEIMTLMAIDSSQFRGHLILRMPNKVMLHIASKMLFEEINEVNEDVTDASGELINMIVGNAKGKLPEYQFELKAPLVVTGDDFQLQALDGSFCVTVPFNTSQGSFEIDIRLLPPSKAIWKTMDEEG